MAMVATSLRCLRAEGRGFVDGGVLASSPDESGSETDLGGDGVRVAVAPASVLAFLAARYRLARSAAADGAADDAGGAGTAAEMAGGGATCSCCPS